MTEQELKKLSRQDLLELLILEVRENERLTVRLAEKEALLQERRIQLERSGSIAEAALQLNGIFEAAQAAADQYLENIRQLEADTRQRCRLMLEQAGRLQSTEDSEA